MPRFSAISSRPLAWGVRRDHHGTYRTAAIGQFPAQVSSFGMTGSGELYVITDRTGRLHSVGFERA